MQGFLDWSSEVGDPGLGQGLSRAGELRLILFVFIYTYTMIFNSTGPFFLPSFPWSYESSNLGSILMAK